MAEKSPYARNLDVLQRKIFEACLKPAGFRKKGRCFNRFADGDLVQIIEFEQGRHVGGEGWNDRFFLRGGLRIPEVSALFGLPDRTFYHYYDGCFTFLFGEGEERHRAIFGPLWRGAYWYDRSYPLDGSMMQRVSELLETHLCCVVLPLFARLETRALILQNQRDLAPPELLKGLMDDNRTAPPDFDEMFRQRELRAAAICRRQGDQRGAAMHFRCYCQENPPLARQIPALAALAGSLEVPFRLEELTIKD